MVYVGKMVLTLMQPAVSFAANKLIKDVHIANNDISRGVDIQWNDLNLHQIYKQGSGTFPAILIMR
ncbi:hypothetical protein CQU01_10660 [Cerasibacillus quisquiliarum]|uniref:Uncharacterized protein n=1 Tax=Cerasibacillus quisquiliarum TaxID=227865 RepID=A0A511UYH9_9BACI|nr:hypothetical protein CQU01_10660 [Cerasibacillus quisquiliarum]